MKKIGLPLILCCFLIFLSANAQINESLSKYKCTTVFDSSFVVMAENGICQTKQHIRYKANNTEGAKSLSLIKFDYEPQSAQVNVLSVKLISHSGAKPKAIKLKDIADVTAPARAIYWGARQKLIPIGKIEPLDEVDIVIEKKGYTYALLHDQDETKFIPPMYGTFYEIIPFWAKEPVLSKFYQVKIPNTKEVYVKKFHAELESSESTLENYKVFKFWKTNIMPLPSEANMVDWSDFAPKIIITTTKTWEEKSRWFYEVNEQYGSFKPNAELKILVDSLLKTAHSEIDSIAILTHWVADNMRYCGLSMGKGEGYTLHNVDMNLSDRCGVCKDKASLLVSMLRVAGFESYAAMTMAGSRIEDIAADQFNHSVSAVKTRNGKFLMLDPTWVPFNRELWSSLEQQQNYLIGTKEGMGLMETEISEPKNHYLNIYNEGEIDEEGNLKGVFTISAEGQSDLAVRNIFMGPKSKMKNALINELRQYADSIKIIYSNEKDPYNYSLPTHLLIQYKIPKYAQINDSSIVMSSPLSNGFFKKLFWHLNLDTSIETRQYPFKTRCTQFIDLEERIKLPKFKTEVSNITNKEKIEFEQASFILDRSIKNGIYTYKNQISINKRVFKAEDWKAVKTVVEAHKKIIDSKIKLAK